MLGYNCEKTVITPPTTTTASNKWTTQIDDNNKVISMASSGGGMVMEKPGQELVQQQQVALRCPRCDSSNTKFCYYNNYSLSQPRHFCKACKRYWTRGGTLRNVPVGGGCRKNKRTSVKRPTTTTTTTSSNNIIDTTTTTTSASASAAASPSSTTPNSQPHIDNHHHPLLYGLPGGGDVMNLLPFPRFNSRVSSSSYDLDQPQLNALGLGFSSGILSSHEVNDDDGYRNGLFSSNNYNTLLSSYGSIFGSFNNSTTTSMPSTPVMASLLSSTLLQQKFNSGSNSPFQGMNMNPLLQELKLEGNGSSGGSVAGLVQASKEVMKGEGQNNRLEWNDNNNGGVCQNQMEQHMGLSDPSSLYWNSNTATATALGAAWSEQPNIGPNSVRKEKEKEKEMEGIAHRTVEVNGIKMHVAEKGEGPVVLFLHGFPELWYSWRHQIVALSSHGYRAVAPDLRGYGDTDAPTSMNSYTCFHIVGDIVALIDSLGVDQVFLVAHDWGAVIGWYLCLFRPDRIKAYVSLSVAYLPRNPKVKPVDGMRALHGDDFYICRFQEPGKAEAELGKSSLEVVIKNMLTNRNPGPPILSKEGMGSNPDATKPLPSWLSKEDLTYYASKFEKTGFTGGLNYYRNLNLNWELTAPWTGARVKVPVKFITGDMDLVYTTFGTKQYIESGAFKKDVPNLEEVVIQKGVAHFNNQEAAEEISNHIYDFIKKF